MDLFRFVVFIVIALCHVAVSSSSGDHEHAGDHDAFHSILEQLGLEHTESLTLHHVNDILTRLSLYNCSNHTQHKCVTGESLFKIFNISTNGNVSEGDFKKFAPIIAYALLPYNHSNEHKHDDEGDDHMHEHDGRMITRNVSLYDELKEKYKTSSLCEQILDQFLKDINTTFHGKMSHDHDNHDHRRRRSISSPDSRQTKQQRYRRDAHGHGHSHSECFSTKDIYRQLGNISTNLNVNKSHLPEVSVIIISRLMNDSCIRIHHETPLPCSSHFAQALFQRYAVNNTVSEGKFKQLLEHLKIGKKPGHDDHKHNSHSDDHGHNHRRRRSITDSFNSQESQSNPLRRYRRDTHTDHHHMQESSRYKKCYSSSEFFQIYHVSSKKGFTFENFQKLTPALVQQIASNSCAADSHTEKSDKASDSEKWGYGFLAVAIVSLCSVFGVAIIPVMDKVFYHKIVLFLIALAVGTLVGDAMLHLFPHALGLDKHNHGGHGDHSGHDDHGHGSESSDDKEYLWKFLVTCVAIYAFFVFEMVIQHFFRNDCGHSVGPAHNHQHNDTELGRSPPSYNDIGMKNIGYSHDSKDGLPNGKTHLPDKPGDKEGKTSIETVAWNILIGDTIHNIADGIAIGVAFSTKVSVGISTSIAVFCHELPHELGDFAVLLNAGMSVKMALLANFLSACSCFLGLVIGVAISDVGDANKWIFAVTAGIFIYVALTDMVPELIHNPNFNALPKMIRIILQNLGMLLGFVLMMLLAYYEEDINV